MAILVNCGCGATYRVGDDKVGRKLRCKMCDTVLVVPGEEEDDWELLPAEEPSKGHRQVLRSTKLPPKVITGKKPKKAFAEGDRPKRRAQSSEPASEFLAPLLVAVIGLAITIVTSMLMKPEGVSTGLWLGIRLAFIAASLVITFVALFIATIFVEADYGYISTGLIKVTAIVLTQDWVGDFAGRIPVPFVGGIIAWLVTYAMFKYFFGLDDMEAIGSMFVVRMVHWAVVMLLFAALIGGILAGRGINLPNIPGEDDIGPGINAPADEIDQEEMGVEVQDLDGAGT